MFLMDYRTAIATYIIILLVIILAISIWAIAQNSWESYDIPHLNKKQKG
jgi:hypothetical protein